VESLDRISRAQILEALEIFTGILNRGIIVVTLADNMEYSKEKANRNFTDLIISITIMSRAHEESLTKSGRLKEAWNAKRKNIDQFKLTKVCPAWLQLNSERTAYEHIPEKVAIVRQIVDLVMSGMGKNSIAKKFNLEGIPSIGNRNKDHSWFPSYIVKIVTSRALIGEFQPKQTIDGRSVAAGEAISDYFPPAIPKERFALLQQLISERGKKSGGNRGHLFSNLFTGFVKCGYCGSSMVFVNKGADRRRNGDSEKNRYLVCTKAKRGAGCHHVPWVYADLEEAFIRDARGIDFQRFVKEAADQTSTIRSFSEQMIVRQAEHQDLVKRQDALVEAIEIGGGQVKPLVEKLSINATRITEIEAQLALLQEKIKSASSLESISKDTLEVIQTLLEQLLTKSGDDLFLLRARINEHLRRVVRELRLFPGGTIHTEAEVQDIVTELKREPSKHHSHDDIDAYAREYRADMDLASQPIMDKVATYIFDSAFVIADLTEWNGNVLYELGLAHASNKDCIIIYNANKESSLPFDVRHIAAIKYDPSDIEALKKNLLAAVKDLLLERRD